MTNTDEITYLTNHFGYRQYTIDDKDICCNCHQLYTNKGQGVLCEQCDPDCVQEQVNVSSV